MITSKDVRNKRFEKAAFGYKQEEIDEFFAQLEAELDEMERERAESNNKIQILADKVREYMKDEDALRLIPLSLKQKQKLLSLRTKLSVSMLKLWNETEKKSQRKKKLLQLLSSRLQTSKKVFSICIKIILNLFQACLKHLKKLRTELLKLLRKSQHQLLLTKINFYSINTAKGEFFTFGCEKSC